MLKREVLDLLTKDFEEKVIKSKIPVIVDFFAPWCGPCQVMLPTIAKAADKYLGKVKIFKVDIEKNPDVASKYSVLSVPTIIFFKKGKPVDQEGFLDENQLDKKIDEFAP